MTTSIAQRYALSRYRSVSRSGTHACAQQQPAELTTLHGGADPPESRNMSDDIAGVLLRHRDRIHEIADVFARYGFAELAAHAADVPDAGFAGAVATKAADPRLAAVSAGERLRGALTELGTTWIKFGQMLSLRPDLVGPDVATEVAQLQADVPADPPGSAEATIGRGSAMYRFLGRSPSQQARSPGDACWCSARDIAAVSAGELTTIARITNDRHAFDMRPLTPMRLQ